MGLLEFTRWRGLDEAADKRSRSMPEIRHWEFFLTGL
jgi:hypothetical protein